MARLDQSSSARGERTASDRRGNRESGDENRQRARSNEISALGRRSSISTDIFGDGEDFATPTITTVGKEKPQYKEGLREFLGTKVESVYIHTVDELYGVQKYLEKVGEFMISVYDVYGSSEVADVVVFAKGTIETYHFKDRKD